MVSLVNHKRMSDKREQFDIIRAQLEPSFGDSEENEPEITDGVIVNTLNEHTEFSDPDVDELKKQMQDLQGKVEKLETKKVEEASLWDYLDLFSLKRKRAEIEPISNKKEKNTVPVRQAIVMCQTSKKTPLFRQDIQAVYKCLKNKGYTVDEITDCKVSEVENSVENCIKKVVDGSKFVFYFSGHGCEENLVNFLLCDDGLYNTNHLVELLDKKRGCTFIIILDCCRTPKDKKGAFEVLHDLFPSLFGVSGLRRNQFIFFYAARHGKKATYDSDDENSYFTEELVKELDNSDSILDVFTVAGARTNEKSNENQRPWLYTNITDKNITF